MTPKRFAAAALAAVLALLAAVPAMPAASSSGVPHPDPHTLPVPFSGAPWYIEFARGADGMTNGTVGTQVSDFGSHFGIKATLLDHRPLYLAHYADGTGFGQKLDRSFFTLASPGGAVLPASKRRVAFSPSSWDESATLTPERSSPLSVKAFATGLSTDAFLLSMRVRNPGPRAVRYEPVFAVESTAGSREFSESAYPGTAEGPATVVSGGAGSPRAVVAKLLSELTVSGLRQAGTTNFRAIAPSFPIAAIDEAHPSDDYTIAVRGEPVTLAPNATAEHYVVLASSDSSAGTADALAAAAFDAVRGDPGNARARVLADWSAFYASLPRPHLTRPAATELWRASHAGLRMNLYAPRAAMGNDWGSLPGKTHFDLFFAWDTGIHTVGTAAWSAWEPGWPNLDRSAGTLAEQQLSTIFRGQMPNGELSIVIDENGIPFMAAYSDPPVQGWAMRAAYEAHPDRARARAWLAKIYEGSARYLDWWDTFRDTDRDGLAEYLSGIETGWDDTPRYVPTTGSLAGFAPVANEDAVDLNAWLVQYAEAMAWAARALGKPAAEAEAWQGRADARARLIEERMWNAARGGWEDLVLDGPEHRQVDVATPTLWWPAFTGVSRDPARIKRVIQSHLLNPSEFFGRNPIPTVAYNDPNYDHENDGAYWRGQIWGVPAYAALQTLATYGYEAEASALRERIVAMMAGKGGPYETYDAKTGEVGWGSNGIGDPSVHLIGLTTATVSEMLLSRYERHRLLFPEASGFHGYVADAAWVTDRAPAFSVDAGGVEVPRVSVDAVGGPLRSAKQVVVRLTDPRGNLSLNPGQRIVLRFPSFDGYGVFAVDARGRRTRVPTLGGAGTTFAASLTGGKVDHSLLAHPAAPSVLGGKAALPATGVREGIRTLALALVGVAAMLALWSVGRPRSRNSSEEGTAVTLPHAGTR